MLQKTISIIKELEKTEYFYDIANAKLFSPILELKQSNYNCDKNFLCEMYPPLTDQEISEYSSCFIYDFPEELKQFYKFTNGIRIFDRYISVGGLEPFERLRPNHGGREYTPIQWIDTWGNSPRPKKHYGDGRLFFAMYKVEKPPYIYAYMDCADSSLIKPVHTCYAGSEEIIESWKSFDDWFFSEYKKYMGKFKNKEYKIISIVDGVLNGLYFI